MPFHVIHCTSRELVRRQLALLEEELRSDLDAQGLHEEWHLRAAAGDQDSRHGLAHDEAAAVTPAGQGEDRAGRELPDRRGGETIRIWSKLGATLTQWARNSSEPPPNTM